MNFPRPVPKVYRDKSPRKRLGHNEDRKAAKFESAFHSEAFVDFIHSLGCATPGCRKTDIECAHVGSTRKNGGRWFEVVPLCSSHHREQEGRTLAFNAKHSIDLLDIAAATALRWRERSE